MENFTQLTAAAEKFNLYTKENIPAVYTQPQVLNGSTFDYSDRLTHGISLPDPLLNEFTHGLFFHAREQMKNDGSGVELYYIEHAYILFLTPKGNMAILRSQKDKYYFSPYYAYFREFQELGYSVKKEVQNMPEPNFIGKFTAKKVSDWLNHVDTKIEAMDKAVKIAGGENARIEAEIQDFINKSGGKVSTWQNKTEVELPGFTVTFTHDKSTQYMYSEIKYKGNTVDLLKLLGKI